MPRGRCGAWPRNCDDWLSMWSTTSLRRKRMKHHLAAILRLADALDRSHDNRVKDVHLTRNGRVAHIQLQSRVNCDREIFAAEQHCDIFEQVFDCRLSLSRRAASKRA